MTELEQLKAQRKELDKKIRELEHPKYEVDGAKCYLQTYTGGRPAEWLVRIEEIDETNGKSSYKQIISARSLDDAIEHIGTQIGTLENLIHRIRQDG